MLAYVADAGFIPGSIYLFVGITSEGSVGAASGYEGNTDTYEYEVPNDAWAKKEQYPVGRMLSGYDDPIQLTQALTAPVFGKLTLGVNGKGYIAGGGLHASLGGDQGADVYRTSEGGHNVTNYTTRFEPGHDAFASDTVHPSAKFRMASASIPDGTPERFVVMGGVNDDGNILKTLHTFTSPTEPGVWAGEDDLPDDRDRADSCGAAVGSDAWFFGGVRRDGTNDIPTDDSLKWDGTAWSVGTSMPSPARTQSLCGAINGDIYLLSGRSGTTGGTFQAQIEKFDPTGNAGDGSWQTLVSPVPEPSEWPVSFTDTSTRFAVTRGVVSTSNDKLFWTGGRSVGGTLYPGHELFRPEGDGGLWEAKTPIPIRWGMGTGGSIG